MEEMSKFTKFFTSFKDLLDEIGLTIMEFSRVSGIKKSCLYRYRAGDMPSIENAVKIANYFDCTLNFLMGIDDEKNYPHLHTYDSSVFYGRFKQMLSDKGISVYRISIDAGVNDSSDYAWQKGREPSMATLVKIAEYLNCQIDYLIGRM